MRFKDENGGEWESITTQSDEVMVLRKRDPNPMPELKPGMLVRIPCPFTITVDHWRPVAAVDYSRGIVKIWDARMVGLLTYEFEAIEAVRNAEKGIIWRREK